MNIKVNFGYQTSFRELIALDVYTFREGGEFYMKVDSQHSINLESGTVACHHPDCEVTAMDATLLIG